MSLPQGRPTARTCCLLLSLSLLVGGCDALAGTPVATPLPVAAATAAPTPTVSPGTPAPGRTPRRPRRPRPSASAVPSPTVTPAPTPRPTPMPPIEGFERVAGSDGRLTVLILGSDARRNLVGERTDTIMVASIDPTTGRIAFASLPRDTVNVPIGPSEVFDSPNRINGLLQAYELGGADRADALERVRAAMAHAFGTEIDGYLLIGFRGVERLVDRIGGIDVFLERALWDPTMNLTKKGLKLKAGWNHLSGKRALAFARTRHTDSDYQRAGRQQQVMVAIATRVLGNGLASLPALAEFALTQVETDLPVEALPVLAQLIERARLRTPKGFVLAPSTYAEPGPEPYTIQMRIDAVRVLFDRVFGPVGP